MWDVIEGTELFSQVHNSHGRYDAKAHLAEMIALLGPPPKELLARSDAMAQQKWPEPFQNAAGKLSWNACQFFDGPFFDGEGRCSMHNGASILTDLSACQANSSMTV